MAMGLDSCKEEMQTNEQVFLQRGLATLVFEGPGQGEAEYDFAIRGDYEAVVKAVIDHVTTRSDVDSARIGERVWLFEGQFGRWLGTAAQYIALPSSRAVALPDAVSFAEAACIGIPAMTAHRAVCADGSVAGQTVLVTGAAGAVGGYAVQFAALSGATVIGTVSSDEKAAQAIADGAAHTIDYKTEDVVARVKALTDGAGVDRVVEVELGGNMPVTSRILKTNAVIAAYASMAVPEAPLPFYPMLRTGPTIEIVACFTVPEADKMQGARDISAWMETGRLRHNVGAAFALDDIVAAHEAVEGGALIGGAVLEID